MPRFSGILLTRAQGVQGCAGVFLRELQPTRFSATPPNAEFVQDNHSRSTCNVLRGLHYPDRTATGKLVSGVIIGEIFRRGCRSSPQFANLRAVVPELGFRRRTGWRHGFRRGLLMGFSLFPMSRRCCTRPPTGHYTPQYERCLRWDDPV